MNGSGAEKHFDEDVNEGGENRAIKSESYTLMQREAARMARNSKTYLFASLFLCTLVSYIGIQAGGFTISNDSTGWISRGSLIANRQTQLLLTQMNAEKLVTGDPDAWDEIIDNVQGDWQKENPVRDTDSRSLKEGGKGKKKWAKQIAEGMSPKDPLSLLKEGSDAIAFRHHNLNANSTALRDNLLPLLVRRLEPSFFGCDWSWYLDNQMTKDTHLWPIWKTKSEEDSFLDADVLEELCTAEQTTQRYLEDNDMCFGCKDGCLPPYSIVFYVRLLVEEGMNMDCKTLAQSWTPQQKRDTEDNWETCADELGKAGDLKNLDASCGSFVYPSLFDEFFTTTGNVQYTSSIFATKSDEDTVADMFDNADIFDRAGVLVEGSYDTQKEDFVLLLSETAVNRDMLLATGSAIITAAAVLIHTRSPYLTTIGFVQIMFSLPLSYFVYTIILGISFFPFLNFIGVFVVFALGADHIFVAVDKWKNARIEEPFATTEEIAAMTLPDAAHAMFLTTSTTSIAFFGTALCKVAPVKLFAMFCGLLIALDYVMCCLLIFPALCIYDRHTKETKGCASCCYTCFQKPDQVNDGEQDNEGEDAGEEKPSFIRQVLLSYYHYLHTFRWYLFVASIISLVVSSWYATKLTLPTNSDVRILSKSIQYEQAYLWRKHLFVEAIGRQGGSPAFVTWGTSPDDTGDYNDPAKWSQLVLDDTFDPSNSRAQVYLRDFCPKLFDESFAEKMVEVYECPFNRFEKWLELQSSNPTSEAYIENCDGATGLPVSEDVFHKCIISWSQQDFIHKEENAILSRDGVVKTITIAFKSRVIFTSANSVLKKEWKLIEDWMTEELSSNAPKEVANAYFTSVEFWWYDTNANMFNTAMGGIGIALGAAALVILVSSKSLILTLFSVIGIAFVLTSVTAVMAGIGWTLGFLESVCFSILIGVSVDFVIHFSHAYVAASEHLAHNGNGNSNVDIKNLDRHDRTKFALIHMGPSVLAAAFTTVAGATIMLFTVITFFQKFAIVLFLTIILSTVGSFVVFLSLTDCIGPSNPTYLYDKMMGNETLPKGAVVLEATAAKETDSN